MSTTSSTSSMPLDQPPPLMITQPNYPAPPSAIHGSVGPVIGVLVVVGVLGVAAAMVGRLCSGRRIMGYGKYDMESWAEDKCSSCIDGRIHIMSPLPRSSGNSGSSNNNVVSVSAVAVEGHHRETEQSEFSPQNV